MALPTESVTLAGSGLVFINYYNDSVTPAFRSAIIEAEHQLQSQFVDATTVGVHFDLKDLGPNFGGQNAFSGVPVSYATLVDALRSHATTADDLAAVNGLPATDPSNGAGFLVPTAEARILGLATQLNISDITVTLSSRLNLTFGQDAVGILLHEITEGVFGRVGSLGLDGTRWEPLDLFRFTQAGVRDYTGGADGLTTYFGIDPSQVVGPAYHSSIDASGKDDGFDLGDWDATVGDAFGPFNAGAPGLMTALDLRVLDVLGWRPTGSGAPFTPAPDDFASSLNATAPPIGQLAVGGSVSGVLEQAGDRDWFRVTLEAGATYTINMLGRIGLGPGAVADSYLRLHDAGGATLAENDDVVSGTQPDSRITFTATTGGTYYVEAGAFVDGYTGAYRVTLSKLATAATAGDDQLGGSGNDTIDGLAGADTITETTGTNYLRGGDGNDSIMGGTGFDDINGNMGDDTCISGGGDDWVVGGKGADSLIGSSGQNLVYGNLGADTCDGGAGNDVVRGGQDNDVVVGGAGDDFVSGDKGDDTMAGGSGADIFHTFGDAGLDRVVDFNLAEGDRVMVDPGTQYTVSQVGLDTVIDMVGGGKMILVGVSMSSLTGNWIFGA